MSVGCGDNRVSHWNSVVDQRSGDTLDNWSSLDSLDSGDNIVDIGQRSVDSRGGVEKSRVSLGLGLSLGDSVDLLSLDHWDIVDTVDWETSVDMVSQGETRVDSSNMVGQGGVDSCGQWSVDSRGGVEESWISLGLGFSISRSLSIVSVWVAISISIGSVSIIIWSQTISVVAIPGISIGFRLSHGHGGESENYNELHL